MLRLKNTQWMAMLLLLWGTGALADDVKIRPAAGNGVVVTNAAGTSERLRVNESGQVFLPGADAALLESNPLLRLGDRPHRHVCAIGRTRRPPRSSRTGWSSRTGRRRFDHHGVQLCHRRVQQSNH